MRGAGFLEEVERPPGSVRPPYRRSGTVSSYPSSGELDVEAGFEDAARATLRLVKRQRTFFRRDPRLQWLDGNDESVVETVLREARL